MPEAELDKGFVRKLHEYYTTYFQPKDGSNSQSFKNFEEELSRNTNNTGIPINIICSFFSILLSSSSNASVANKFFDSVAVQSRKQVYALINKVMYEYGTKIYYFSFTNKTKKIVLLQHACHERNFYLLELILSCITDDERRAFLNLPYADLTSSTKLTTYYLFEELYRDNEHLDSGERAKIRSMIRLLLQAGLEPSLLNHKYETPFDFFLKKKYKDYELILEFLLADRKNFKKNISSCSLTDLFYLMMVYLLIFCKKIIFTENKYSQIFPDIGFVISSKKIDSDKKKQPFDGDELRFFDALMHQERIGRDAVNLIDSHLCDTKYDFLYNLMIRDINKKLLQTIIHRLDEPEFNGIPILKLYIIQSFILSKKIDYDYLFIFLKKYPKSSIEVLFDYKLLDQVKEFFNLEKTKDILYGFDDELSIIMRLSEDEGMRGYYKWLLQFEPNKKNHKLYYSFLPVYEAQSKDKVLQSINEISKSLKIFVKDVLSQKALKPRILLIEKAAERLHELKNSIYNLIKSAEDEELESVESFEKIPAELIKAKQTLEDTIQEFLRGVVHFLYKKNDNNSFIELCIKDTESHFASLFYNPDESGMSALTKLGVEKFDRHLYAWCLNFEPPERPDFFLLISPIALTDPRKISNVILKINHALEFRLNEISNSFYSKRVNLIIRTINEINFLRDRLSKITNQLPEETINLYHATVTENEDLFLGKVLELLFRTEDLVTYREILLYERFQIYLYQPRENQKNEITNIYDDPSKRSFYLWLLKAVPEHYKVPYLMCHEVENESIDLWMIPLIENQKEFFEKSFEYVQYKKDIDLRISELNKLIKKVNHFRERIDSESGIEGKEMFNEEIQTLLSIIKDLKEHSEQSEQITSSPRPSTPC